MPASRCPIPQKTIPSTTRPGQEAGRHPLRAFGPTTAGRMDSYVDQFRPQAISMVMIAKGNRSQQVTDAYQARRLLPWLNRRPGDPRPRLHQECRTPQYPELGMEAIWKIEVEDFPAFILVDNKGNDFFKQLKPRCPLC